MISIIIPVFNNSKTLEKLSERIIHTLNDHELEIIYINDGSTDNSLIILKELHKKYNQIRIISFSRNFGQHPAISAGFENAKGEQIVLMDADLQDKPENIPKLIDNLKNNIDIVYTIRKDKKKSFIKDVTSNIFHNFTAKQVGVNVPKNIGTLRVFSRKVLNALLQYKEVNVLYGPLMYYIGFNHCYVEVDRDERPGEKSSYSFFKRLELGVNTLITYSDLPYRVFINIGVLIIIGSIVYATMLLVQYFFYGQMLPDGITIIIFILALMFGVIVFGLGIVGFYLYRSFQEVLRRPKYLVDFSTD